MYRTMFWTAGVVLLAAFQSHAGLHAGYVYNANDFATQVISYSGPVDPRSAYSNPAAILGQPALLFNNSTINPNIQDIHRSKLIEAPFNYGPGSVATRQPVVTVLPNFSGANPAIASVVVKMGRPVADDRFHAYGMDLIVFGNSFYAGAGDGFPNDSTNLNSYALSGEALTHAVDVAVSPDNLHWFSFPTLSDGIQPYNAYKWNRSSASWSDDMLDPTVPLNPSVYSMNVAGKSTADVLDSYGNSAGGTALDLKNARDASGQTLAQRRYLSIQYVRLSSTIDDYAVISGVSAVGNGFERVGPPTFTPIDTVQLARAVPEPAAIAMILLASLALCPRRR